MASCSCYSVNFNAAPFNPNKPITSPPSQLARFSSFQSKHPFLSLHLSQNLSRTRFRKSKTAPSLVVKNFSLFFLIKSFGNFLIEFHFREQVVASGDKTEPLRVMISGAPASGKGTQCELITKKVNLFLFLFLLFIVICFIIVYSVRLRYTNIGYTRLELKLRHFSV